VIEDRAFPASGVVEISRHLLLARDAARRVEQFAPRARRHRDEVLAVEEHATIGFVPQAEHVSGWIRQRLDGERQKVGAILGGPVRLHRLYVVGEQRQPVAVDRREVRQPARRRRELQLRLVQLEARHHRHVQLYAGMRARPVVEHDGECVGDGRTGGEVKVVGLGPDVERQRRVGASDPDRRDEVVLRAGDGRQREREHERKHGVWERQARKNRKAQYFFACFAGFAFHVNGSRHTPGS
jgi:hypothetical protein